MNPHTREAGRGDKQYYEPHEVAVQSRLKSPALKEIQPSKPSRLGDSLGKDQGAKGEEEGERAAIVVVSLLETFILQST